MFELFLKGLLIGFAIAAPVGPIGILCIQRSLHDGFKVGLMSGMGAALADGTYGLIAGFGLTAISALLISHQLWIRIIDGVFLLYFGIKLILTTPRKKDDKNNFEKSPWHACGTTYLLKLTNPTTILSFIAVFAGLGLETTNPGISQAILLVAGITIGSAVWWIIFSGGISFILHKRMNPIVMRIINWISACILFGFGAWAIKGVL